MTRLRKLLLACGSLFALGLFLEPTPALAICPGTIVNGETQTVTATLANGENCTIDEGGAITTTNVDAINATNDDNAIVNNGAINTTGDFAEGVIIDNRSSVLNNGTINTTGQGAEGILANFSDNTIINNGTIGTTGSAATALFAASNSLVINNGILSTLLNASDGIGGNGDGNTIVNSGTITTMGDNSDGIDTDDNNSIVNSGNINTMGFGSDGIGLVGDNNRISNTGGISTTGDSAVGIFAFDNNWIWNSGAITTLGTSSDGISVNDGNTIVNWGSIDTSGTGAEGIFARDNNTIFNHGTIRVTGPGALGVRALISNAVTNAGLISATGAGSSAITFDEGTNHLTLLPGSVIVGLIGLGTGSDTLTVGNGLSIANSFDAANGPPEIINANGAPFAVNGNQVAVVDPTLEALQDEILIDTINAIFGGVSSRLDGLANGTVVGVTQPPGTFAGAMRLGPNATYKGTYAPDAGERQAWAHGFGAARNQDRHAPTVDADHRLGGIMSGMDGQISAVTRAGFFLGGSWGEADTDFNSQDEDIDTFFAGIYGRREMGRLAVDATFTVGHSSHDRTRRVANNLAPGGIQTAIGEFDGVFVAAELGLAAAMPVGQHRVVPSVHFRYAGHFLDGFTEVGAAGNLTLSDRNVHVVQGRGQIAFPMERYRANGAVLRGELKMGIEGRANVGDDAFGAVLVGQTIAFAPGGRDETGSIYGGTSVDYTLPNGRTKLYAGVEGGFEIGGAAYTSGRGGFKITF